ncbi:MAG: hypothetical protein ACFB9M_11765 [Myxococcota bacterium]
MTAFTGEVGYDPVAVSDGLVSPQVSTILMAHGIATEPHIELYDAAEVQGLIARILGAQGLHEHATLQDVASAARRHRLSVVVTHARSAPEMLETLSRENLVVGVLVFDPEGFESNSAALRAQGVMDVLTALEQDDWAAALTRGFDFRGLLLLELDHRCESKRLSQRELQLLGEPPESLSDDLDTFQPPPLPVGPLSVYDLETASDAFETAYIERVQYLCSSSREAAQVLGVSPATLSRRQRKESE